MTQSLYYTVVKPWSQFIVFILTAVAFFHRKLSNSDFYTPPMKRLGPKYRHPSIRHINTELSYMLELKLAL